MSSVTGQPSVHYIPPASVLMKQSTSRDDEDVCDVCASTRATISSEEIVSPPLLNLHLQLVNFKFERLLLKLHFISQHSQLVTDLNLLRSKSPHHLDNSELAPDCALALSFPLSVLPTPTLVRALARTASLLPAPVSAISLRKFSIDR